MGFESMTDEKIKALLRCSKKVTNAGAKDVQKASHFQRNYKVISPDGQEFTLFVRQNKFIEDNFSCGLRWHAPSGDELMLVRYNGSSHYHPNALEGTETDFECHIHFATERYIKANKRPEGYAEATDRYFTVNGALYCLVKDCNISGILVYPDEPDLFK